jgi:hypothetical protein
MIAGWINRHQQQVITCLLEENRTLHTKRWPVSTRSTAVWLKSLPLNNKASPDILQSAYTIFILRHRLQISARRAMLAAANVRFAFTSVLCRDARPKSESRLCNVTF